MQVRSVFFLRCMFPVAVTAAFFLGRMVIALQLEYPTLRAAPVTMSLSTGHAQCGPRACAETIARKEME